MKIQGISISRTGTEDVQGLLEIVCTRSSLIAAKVIVSNARSIIGDQEGCHINIKLRGCRDHFIQSVVGVQEGHPTLKMFQSPKCRLIQQLRGLLYLLLQRIVVLQNRYTRGRHRFSNKNSRGDMVRGYIPLRELCLSLTIIV